MGATTTDAAAGVPGLWENRVAGTNSAASVR